MFYLVTFTLVIVGVAAGVKEGPTAGLGWYAAAIFYLFTHNYAEEVQKLRRQLNEQRKRYYR